MSLLTCFIWIMILLVFFQKSGVLKWTQIPQKLLCGFFLYKLLFTFTLIYIYEHYYTDRNLADIFKYYDDSKILFGILLEDPSSFFKLLLGLSNEDQYMSTLTETNTWYTIGFGSDHLYNDSRTIIRINAFLLPFSFGNYYIQAFYFSLIGFIGQIILYKNLSKIKGIHNGLLLTGIFLMPSVAIWTSGILKESFLILGIALLVRFMVKHQTNERQSKDFLLLLVGISLLLLFKYYVLLCLTPGLLVFLAWKKNQKKIAFKYVGITLLFFILAIFIKYIHPSLNIMQMLVKKHDDFYLLALEMDAKSISYIGKYHPVLNEFIPKIPIAFFNSLLLPFIHQLNLYSPVMIPAIFENSILLFLTVWVVLNRKNSFNSSQLNWIYFSMIFVLLLYTLSGLTTPVLGGLVRYKVPGLIFHIFILSLIVDVNKLPFLSKSSQNE